MDKIQAFCTVYGILLSKYKSLWTKGGVHVDFAVRDVVTILQLKRTPENVGITHITACLCPQRRII